MISVVIPTIDSEEQIGSLLQQLSRGEVQIIVSDGGSNDKTLHYAVEAEANLAIGTQSRGEQLNRGVFLARESWLLFLHADSKLSDNWLEAVQSHIAKHPNMAGYFRLRFDSPRFKARIVERVIALRCFAWNLPYGDQGLLISRTFFDEIGGYPDWQLFEDVKIVENIGAKRLRPLPSKIYTSAVNYHRDGFFKRGWRNFKLLRRYKNGDTVENLHRDYT